MFYQREMPPSGEDRDVNSADFVLLPSTIPATSQIQNFKPLLYSSVCVDLVGNPEDRFSGDETHLRDHKKGSRRQISECLLAQLKQL